MHYIVSLVWCYSNQIFQVISVILEFTQNEKDNSSKDILLLLRLSVKDNAVISFSPWISQRAGGAKNTGGLTSLPLQVTFLSRARKVCVGLTTLPRKKTMLTKPFQTSKLLFSGILNKSRFLAGSNLTLADILAYRYVKTYITGSTLSLHWGMFLRPPDQNSIT